jgi:hypothetical protein
LASGKFPGTPELIRSLSMQQVSSGISIEEVFRCRRAAEKKDRNIVVTDENTYLEYFPRFEN